MDRFICIPNSNSKIKVVAEKEKFYDVFKLMNMFRFSAFGQMAPAVRFLEDQDGAAAWESLLHSEEEIEIAPIFENFQQSFKSIDRFESLREGYHFVDIPIASVGPLRIPRYRMKLFLTDFDNPRRLLELEDRDYLNSEPCGELDILCKSVGPARTSEFLPEVLISCSGIVVCLTRSYGFYFYFF